MIQTQQTLTKKSNNESPMQLQGVVEPVQKIYYHPSQLTCLADEFETIGLNEMECVALQDRTDTKYLLTSQELLAALRVVQQDYLILCVQGNRFNHYRTLYFDTPDFMLYNLHINEHADCYKVRSREYLESQQFFLEVKHKTNKGRTLKERLETEQPLAWLTFEAEDWLEDVFPLQGRPLEPKLWNNFTRLTLVNLEKYERVTLDMDLMFSTTGKSIRFNNITIAEVKRNSGRQASPFVAHMQAMRIQPQGFSKYCMGVSMLVKNVKRNSLKPRLLQIEKMMGGISHE